MIKLKNILTEGFAWERKEGKGLPTLAEVQAEYERKMAGTAKPIDEFDSTNVEDILGFDSGSNRDPKTGNLYDTSNSEENDDAYLAANEAIGEDGRTETISAKRATAELKQKLAGKRSDGMGAYTSTIYGVDASGKKVKLTSLNDITKFKTFGITEKEPRWQDDDSDDKWYEPGVDVKENVNESFIGRLKKNLLGGAIRK